MTKTAAPNSKPLQARALATRGKLLDAARQAFYEHGVEGTSIVEHILKPAGVSTGSFYHQFADKTDLLVELISDSIDERHRLILGNDANAVPIANGTSGSSPTDLQTSVRLALERFFDSLDNERHAWRIQLSEQHNADARVRDMVLAGRERWIEEVASELSPFSTQPATAVRQASMALISFATGTAHIYLSLDSEERAEHRAEFLARTVSFATAGTEALLG